MYTRQSGHPFSASEMALGIGASCIACTVDWRRSVDRLFGRARHDGCPKRPAVLSQGHPVNERLFWASIFPRLIPVQVNAAVDAAAPPPHRIERVIVHFDA